MYDEELEAYLRPLPNPDRASRFEIALRKHRACVGIVEKAHALAEIHSLDPVLAEDVEEAVRNDDHAELLGACCRLLEALPRST